jgi:flagellar hook-associated protein 2
MGKEMVDGTSSISAYINSDATRMNGTDARIILNGAEFKSSSSTFEINGLTIKATGLTKDDEPLTINTDTDVQGLYDKIKDFLSEYNNVINELCSLYNADSASGYEPLTDDEKDSMSDTEVEKWETKIKDSLLRRDSTIGGVITAMTNSMMKTYEVNGKTYSLSSFGIKTLGYLNAAENENYAYHIDGDSEDDASSGNTDKLMAALNSDPDSVISFMKQLTSGLYSSLDTKMKSTTMSSAYTIYNDKQMASEYSSYTTLISTWEDRIEEMEDRYYEQFSNMETALAKLQNSSSSVSSLFGTS